MFGQEGHRIVDGADHFLLRLTYGNPSDCVAIEIQLDEFSGGLLAQIRVDRALNDAEVVLATVAGAGFVGFDPVLTAFRPSGSQAERFCGIFFVTGVGRTFVEEHRDVRADRGLDVHAAFRGEKHPCPVEVVLETDPLLGDFSQLRQRPDLKAARVGKDGLIPRGKFVESAEIPDQICTGAEPEVIGIAEDDLCAELLQLTGVKGFDRTLCADRHEDRRFHGAVGQHHTATAGARVRISREQREHQRRAAEIRGLGPEGKSGVRGASFAVVVFVWSLPECPGFQTGNALLVYKALLEHAIVKLQWWHVVFAAIAGIAVGRFSNGASGGVLTRKNEQQAGSTYAETKAGARNAAPVKGNAAGQALGREIAKAKPDQVAGLAYRTLEIGDPLERRQRLMEVLSRLDESNCLAVMDMFAKVTRETGRLQYDEWKAGLFAVGQRGGAVAMNAWKERGRLEESDESWQSMSGWGSADPQAAKAWLEQPGNVTEAQRKRLMAALLSGYAMADPDGAIRMLDEQPEMERFRPLEVLSDSMIQSQGLDRAVDWMLDVQRREMDTSPEFAQAVENEVYKRIFGAAQFTGGAREMAAQLEKIHRVKPIPPERMTSLVNQMRGVSSLDLVNHLSRAGVLGQDEASNEVIAQAIKEANRRNSAETAVWLEKHTASPLHDRLRAGMEAEGMAR